MRELHCMLTASKKKGHDYYYCTNGKGKCAEHTKYMRSEFLDTLVADKFKNLQIDEELVEMAYEAAKEQAHIGQSYLAQAKEKLINELAVARQKQNKLLDTYLAELVPEDVYKAKTELLNNEIVSVENEIKKLDRKLKGMNPLWNRSKTSF